MPLPAALPSRGRARPCPAPLRGERQARFPSGVPGSPHWSAASPIPLRCALLPSLVSCKADSPQVCLAPLPGTSEPGAQVGEAFDPPQTGLQVSLVRGEAPPPLPEARSGPCWCPHGGSGAASAPQHRSPCRGRPGPRCPGPPPRPLTAPRPPPPGSRRALTRQEAPGAAPRRGAGRCGLREEKGDAQGAEEPPGSPRRHRSTPRARQPGCTQRQPLPRGGSSCLPSLPGGLRGGGGGRAAGGRSGRAPSLTPSRAGLRRSLAPSLPHTDPAGRAPPPARPRLAHARAPPLPPPTPAPGVRAPGRHRACACARGGAGPPPSPEGRRSAPPSPQAFGA